MQISPPGTSEVAIFSRILERDRAALPATAARAILSLDFTVADKERMLLLSAKVQEEVLSPAEQAEIDNYELVGHILSLWKSKARRSLAKRGQTTELAIQD